MPKFTSNLSFMFPEVAFLERFQAAADGGLHRRRVRLRL